MRIYHLFYMTALIAASVNLFGAFGFVIGCLVAGAWLYVYRVRDRKLVRSGFELLVLSVTFFAFFCCIIPGLPIDGRAVARRMQCLNNVKNISLALLNYQSDWKKFPPAITYDAAGQPMHSWRVLILPYLDERPLYEKYSFSEPWDGPNNAKLLSQMPTVFRCPFHLDRATKSFTTSYRVLLGDQTCFPPNGSRKKIEPRVEASQTILVVESNVEVPWMKPSDPTLEEYCTEVKSWLPARTPHNHSNLLEHIDRGGVCAMADGSVRHFNAPVDEELLKRLAIFDNSLLTDDEVEMFLHPNSFSRVRWEGYIAIAAFFGMAIVPAFWIFGDKETKLVSKET